MRRSVKGAGGTLPLWTIDELSQVRLTGEDRARLAALGAELDAALRRRKAEGVGVLVDPVNRAALEIRAQVRRGVTADDLVTALSMRHHHRGRWWVRSVIAARTID